MTRPRILIVSAAIPLLAGTFRRHGFEPDLAVSEGEASQRLSGTRYDVILLNPLRPLLRPLEVLDGLAGTPNESSPVVLLASREQDVLVDEARKRGVRRVVFLQDLRPTELVDVIRKESAR